MYLCMHVCIHTHTHTRHHGQHVSCPPAPASARPPDYRVRQVPISNSHMSIEEDTDKKKDLQTIDIKQG